MEDYVLGVYEKSMPGHLTTEEKLTAAREAGFDFMELSVDETPEKLGRLNWTDNERWQMILAMRNAGFPIRSMCLSGHRKYPLGHPDPQIRRESLAIMEKAVGLAAETGIRIIQIAGYDVYYEKSTEETRSLFAENLARSVEIAAREGVILAIETMENDFLNTVEKGMHWVGRAASPFLQMYPDTGNIVNAAAAAGKDVLEDLETGRGHIAAMHLKESRPGVYREVPYGEGHVDFSAVIPYSQAMGNRRYLAEFWYDGGDDWAEKMKNNNQFPRKYFKAGNCCST